MSILTSFLLDLVHDLVTVHGSVGYYSIENTFCTRMCAALTIHPISLICLIARFNWFSGKAEKDIICESQMKNEYKLVKDG